MWPAKPCTTRLGVSLSCAGLLCLASPAWAQVTPRCSDEIADYVAELPLEDGEVRELRIMERTNIADDFGPDIFGVDAWIRLNSCSGFVVLNLNSACFMRQAYTRGDCQVDGLSNF